MLWLVPMPVIGVFFVLAKGKLGEHISQENGFWLGIGLICIPFAVSILWCWCSCWVICTGGKKEYLKDLEALGYLDKASYHEKTQHRITNLSDASKSHQEYFDKEGEKIWVAHSRANFSILPLDQVTVDPPASMPLLDSA